MAGTAYGYRWWTLKAPPGLGAGQSPSEAEWQPGLLRGQKDTWQPGVNVAKCLPYGMNFSWHDEQDIPEISCGCGYWAYWKIQDHDIGAGGSLPVVGVVKASGNVLMGPLGFRAGKAEIVALFLPFHLDLLAPVRDPVNRALRRNWRDPALRPQRRFTGKVISFPGAPPVPPSLGGAELVVREEPEPEGPSEAEVAEAEDRAEAWMAVIADRLQQLYPGAEVCATLDYMVRKYPVTDEYAAEKARQQALENEIREPPSYLLCPFCAEQVELGEVHKHIMDKHL